MFQLFKNAKNRKAEKLSRDIVKINKRIEDCDICIQDAIIFHDTNGKIMHQDRKRSLMEDREKLIDNLRKT